MNRLLPGVLAALLLALGPARALTGENDIVAAPYDSALGTFSSPLAINTLLGAQTFYDAGYFGQRTTIANVEAGFVWGGHEVFDRTGLNVGGAPALTYADASAAGEVDFHATMVGHVLAGTGLQSDGSLSLVGAGMAPLATLWSGAIATSFDSANIGSFEISDDSFLTPYKAFFTGSLGTKPDVINSSWGFDDPAGTTKENRILTALAAENPTVAFVRSAGNGGPTAAPGVGYNGIVVGSLGGHSDPKPYLQPSTFSSSAAADFYNPVTGQTLTGVRAAVDISAPGEDLFLAAYLGDSGSLAGTQYVSATPPTDQYFVNQAGTSFSAPIVAGGIGLLKDVSYGGVYLSGQAEARDTRVLKSVIQAGATETSGWNNGQVLINGVTVTTQALDYATGAGRLDLDKSAAIYVGGTTDVAGTGGGAIQLEGWDYGVVGAGGHNDYFFDLTAPDQAELTVALNWFVNESFDAATGQPAYQSFVNLDLSVWSVVDGLFTEEIASSESLYNNSEFLRVALAGGGSYGLRVTFSGTVYDVTGGVSSEAYGVAWTLGAAPEPAEWGIAMGLLVLAILWRRRKLVRAGRLR
jgi:hypothetical protein